MSIAGVSGSSSAGLAQQRMQQAEATAAAQTANTAQTASTAQTFAATQAAATQASAIRQATTTPQAGQVHHHHHHSGGGADQAPATNTAQSVPSTSTGSTGVNIVV